MDCFIFAFNAVMTDVLRTDLRSTTTRTYVGRVA